MSQRLALGLDAGGTETHLLAEWDAGADRMERRGPAANLQRAGTDAVVSTLGALIRDVLRERESVGRVAVCAGVAGAGRVDEQEEVQGRLQAALAGAAEEVRVAVTHDAAIALEAAFGSENGLVVIAGTGSVVFGRGGGGTTQRAGGWGHRLGDLGSGHAVGRAGLRAVAAALDGGPRTTLQARVQERYDIGTRAELLRWAYREKTALANVAPLVGAAAAAGDAVAEEILVSQTAALARQAAWVVDAVGDPAPHIAVLGGMLRSEPYAQALRQALRAQMPTASVERLQQAPVAGALRRAHQMQA